MVRDDSSIVHLAEQINKRQVLLILGPDLPSLGTDFPPNNHEIAQPLAKECDYPEQERISLSDVATKYIEKYSRSELKDYIIKNYYDVKWRYSELHRLMISLPFRAVITTAYDQVIEIACEEEGPEFTVKTIDNLSGPRVEEHRLSIIRLCCAGNTPDSKLVITEVDFKRLFRRGSTNLRKWLANHTCLFMGWNPEKGTIFYNFYHNVLDDISAHPDRAHHIIWQTTESEIFETWNNERLHKFHIHYQSNWGFFTKLSRLCSPRPLRDPISTSPKQRGFCWKFLDYYKSRESQFFFGRDDDCEWILDQMYSQSLFLLTGPSGIGKTSLIQAGLIPRLKSNDRMIIYVRCRSHPLKEMQDAIYKKIGKPADLDPKNNTDVASFMEKVLKQYGSRKELIFFIDQFETFFLRKELIGSEEYKTSFLKPLNDLIEKEENLQFIFSIREDYAFDVYKLSDYVPGFLKAPVSRIAGLSEDNARKVIKETAKVCGLTVEDELVEQMLRDLRVSGSNHVDPSALQITCHTLSDKCGSGKYLSLNVYHQLDGAEGILNTYLDESLKKVESALEEQVRDPYEIARSLLKKLTGYEGTNEPQRRIKIIEQVAYTYGIPDEDVNKVLKQLITLRVIRAIGSDEEECELVHEYIVKRVSSWISEDEKDILDILRALNSSLHIYQSMGFSLHEKIWQTLNNKHQNSALLRHLSLDHWELLILSAGEKDENINSWVISAYKEYPQILDNEICIKILKKYSTVILDLMKLELPSIHFTRLLHILLEIKGSQQETERWIDNKVGNKFKGF